MDANYYTHRHLAQWVLTFYRFLTIVTNYGMPKTRTTSYYLKQYQTELTRPSRHTTELTQKPSWYQAELTRFR